MVELLPYKYTHKGIIRVLFGLCGWLSGLFGAPCTQGRCDALCVLSTQMTKSKRQMAGPPNHTHPYSFYPIMFLKSHKQKVGGTSKGEGQGAGIFQKRRWRAWCHQREGQCASASTMHGGKDQRKDHGTHDCFCACRRTSTNIWASRRVAQHHLGITQHAKKNWCKSLHFLWFLVKWCFGEWAPGPTWVGR